MGKAEDGKGTSDSEVLNRILLKLESLENDLKGLKEQSNESALDLKSLSENLRRDFDSVGKKLESQAVRIIVLEKQVRKRNLIWFGIPEKDKNPAQDLDTLVKLVQNQLGVDFQPDDVEDVWRVGKKRETPDPDRPRPICLELRSVMKKRQILAAKSALSSTKFAVKEDLPMEERERRRNWWLQNQNVKNLPGPGPITGKRGASSPADKGRPSKAAVPKN
ncbi:Hypothetical protein NTJ_13626 [Nesidiocoris tenuis]|uniref:Uncharacterized protein n=1 Tax=Nesidiocoris tenuis TaxID=355587 RepID=A0ABN7B978_9HEMI|nr:Hypothetical protein NTJ_13626 [Nesidiocoris tenuis]